MNEKSLVKKVGQLFEGADYPGLEKIYVHTNLATKKFHELWQEWWEGKFPAKLEVDMIFVFREQGKVFLPALEVKYFRDTSPRDFREGVQQALSFGLFGFDSLLLWHIFPGDMPREEVESISKPCKELVEGFKLPMVYFATRITEKGSFEFSAPWQWYSSMDVGPYKMVDEIKNSCMKMRNPLLKEDEVIKRRNVLKVLLKIPI